MIKKKTTVKLEEEYIYEVLVYLFTSNNFICHLLKFEF